MSCGLEKVYHEMPVYNLMYYYPLLSVYHVKSYHVLSNKTSLPVYHLMSLYLVTSVYHVFCPIERVLNARAL